MTWHPPGDPEFSTYYDTLCSTDDVEAYDNGEVTIEVNTLDGTYDLYTNIADLEALLKRIRAWLDARKAYKESNDGS